VTFGAGCLFRNNTALASSSAEGHGFGPAGGRASASGGAIFNVNGSVIVGHDAVADHNNATAVGEGDEKATGAVAQSGFVHVIGSRAVLILNVTTVTGNTVGAHCRRGAAGEEGCEVESGAAIAISGAGDDGPGEGGPPAVLLALVRFAAGQDVNATAAPAAAIGCEFAAGAELTGTLPRGGAYSCDSPPPVAVGRCDAATTACSSAVRFGFECDCVVGHARLNATACSAAL
jgi:hypothetical protein